MLEIPMLVVLVALGHLVGVRCQPYEAFPLSAQWPPVAKVGEEFTFQISNDTFQSNASDYVQIAYEAFELPQWLSFDSSALTFSGIASTDDLDDGLTTYVPIVLQGTDPTDDGALNKSYSLAVTNKTSIDVASNFNLIALLKNYGSTNGEGGLILSPNQVFNITFDRDSFTNQDYITEYYGLSEPYNAPLPSWVVFDANSLEFSGVAPVAHSDIAPQMKYEFALGATDVNGYTSASISFSIVVGAHELTTSIQNTLLVNVSSTGNFQYELPLDYVYLDNETISNDELGSIELQNAPSWVTLDNNTLTGQMSVDNYTSSVNFSVAVHDIYDDAIYWNFEVESTHKLFATDSLPDLNATRGNWFQYYFLPSQFTDINDTQVSMNFTNSSQNHDWITFHSSNLTMLGKVPDDFQSLSLALVAKQDSESQSLDFKLIGMNSTHHNRTSSSSSSHSRSRSSSHSSSRSSSTSQSHTHARTRSSGSLTATATSSTSSSSTSVVATSEKVHSGNNTAAIAAGVVVPVAVIAASAIFFFLWWRRKSGKNDKDTEKSADISNPELGNPANRPDQDLSQNPFDDENSLSNAERMGVLGALNLDKNSYSGSDISTFEDEKRHSLDDGRTMHHELASNSNEMLLPNLPPTSHQHDSDYFSPNDRSSSVYLESEPVTRKSWRYTGSSRPERSLRGSVKSSSTVSTADLFNTVIREDRPLPRDPRKSTLGPRDSVFWERSSPTKSSHSRSRGKFNSDSDMLPILDEQSNNSNYRPKMTMSSLSSDELVPLQENGKFNWVHRPKANNQNQSQKRLVQTQNESNVDVGQVDEVEGRVPEQI